eukprot:6203785-Pleurochrysis_carterae.AAC.7
MAGKSCHPRRSCTEPSAPQLHGAVCSMLTALALRMRRVLGGVLRSYQTLFTALQLRRGDALSGPRRTLPSRNVRLALRFKYHSQRYD